MRYKIVYHPANAKPYIIHYTQSHLPVPGHEYMYLCQAVAARDKLEASMDRQPGGWWDDWLGKGQVDVSDYDAVEVQGCAEVGTTDDPVVEVVDAEEAQFWSAYAHLKMGGVECIGDFDTCDEAVAYANAIANRYGWRTV